jgi:hypothetical protein
MEPKIEKNMAKITFANQPKLSEHEADAKFNEVRISLLPYITEYLSSSEFFKDKEVIVNFSHKGVSSLVAIIEITGEKYVLKISLSESYSFGEGQFLQAWEKVGVKVPHVFETGKIFNRPYTLMECIDALPLSDVLETFDEQKRKEATVEMGRILQTMHTSVASGYGRSLEGEPEFATFKDWLDCPDMKKRFDYVLENKLLGDEHGSVARMSEILIAHALASKSTYCHDDFGSPNIFATEPLTVFDPNPRFNDGYIDLGRSLFGSIVYGRGEQVCEQLIEGYFDGKPYDKQALHASILLASYMKFPYSHKTKRMENIKRAQDYLIKNRYLLEAQTKYTA